VVFAVGRGQIDLADPHDEGQSTGITAALVGERALCYAEQPGTGLIERSRDLLKSPPGHEEHVGDDILRRDRMDASFDEPQQVVVRGIEQPAELGLVAAYVG